MLAGNLTEFGLQDVIQLLALTKKTGVLHMGTSLGDGLLEVRDGEVTYCVADRRRMPLAARLLAEDLIEEEALGALVRAQADGGDGVAAALAAADLDEAGTEPIVREQLIDALFELLRSSEGTFSFSPVAHDEPGAVVVQMPSQDLLEQATARLSEWSRIADRLPGDDAVLALASSSPAGGVLLEEHEWGLVVLLDGHRTLADVVALSGRGRHPTCVLLADLVERGIIEAADGSERTGLAELVRRRDLLAGLEHRQLGAPPSSSDRRAAFDIDAPVREAKAAEMLRAELELDPELDTATDQNPEPASEEPEVREPAELCPGANSGPHVKIPLSRDSPHLPPALASPKTHVPSSAPPEVRRKEIGVDRAAVARELAALGLADEAPRLRKVPTPSTPSTPSAPTAPSPPSAPSAPSAQGDAKPAPKTEDDLGKGLLTRLFDGVKGQ